MADSVASGSTIGLADDSETQFTKCEPWNETSRTSATNGSGGLAWNTTKGAAGTYLAADDVFGQLGTSADSLIELPIACRRM